MTEQGVEDALCKIEEEKLDEDKVMVVYLPECHESLAGIIAGRIREKYYKPVFVLTKGEDCVKGSGRSIDSYSMYEEMSKCKELFLKFGGHKLAAGLSMEEANVEMFRKTLNDNCTLTEEELEEKVYIDLALPFACATEEFMEELKLLEPFGTGNSKPIFAQRNVTFLSMRIMGKTADMARFSVEDESGKRYSMILFRNLDRFLKDVEEKYGTDVLNSFINQNRNSSIKMHVIYYPSINEYMGRREIQYVLQSWI